MWNGKQILPVKWVEEATKAQVKSNPSVVRRPLEEDDWAQGYGYQFWRCKTGGYRADGAFGQFSMVHPDKDLVVAITGESFDLQASMNLVWNTLFPAVKASPSLPPDADAQQKLKQKLKSLSIPAVALNSSSPLASKISGKVFTLDANDFKGKNVSFKFSENSCVFTLIDDRGKRSVTCGINKWIENKIENNAPFALPERMDAPSAIAASATWSDDRTLVIAWRFTEMGHGDKLICTFDDKSVTIKFLNSVAQGNPNAPEKRLELRGIA
jgi:hypothetical protein